MNIVLPFQHNLLNCISIISVLWENTRCVWFVQHRCFWRRSIWKSVEMSFYTGHQIDRELTLKHFAGLIHTELRQKARILFFFTCYKSLIHKLVSNGRNREHFPFIDSIFIPQKIPFVCRCWFGVYLYMCRSVYVCEFVRFSDAKLMCHSGNAFENIKG